MLEQENWIKASLNGDKKALEQLILSIQDNVYNLAMRFLWSPMDAQDATQEIIIKVITNLNSFQFKSAFNTWVYRVASNYLLNLKRGNPIEQLTFEIGAGHLKEGLNHADYNEADKELLAQEVKMGCTTSMLICLSRSVRLVYIFGEILGFNSKEGAAILDLSRENFRKQLSNGRKKIRSFMNQNCGLYNPQLPCRCSKQITYDIKIERIHKNNLLFANKGQVKKSVEELEMIQNEIAIFQSHPQYDTPAKVINGIRNLIRTKQFSILN